MDCRATHHIQQKKGPNISHRVPINDAKYLETGSTLLGYARSYAWGGRYILHATKKPRKQCLESALSFARRYRIYYTRPFGLHVAGYHITNYTHTHRAESRLLLISICDSLSCIASYREPSIGLTRSRVRINNGA